MLELQRNLYVLRRWWWLLLLAAVIGGVLAYGLTKVLAHQKYEGTAIIALAPPPQGASGQLVTSLAATADAQLIPTQAVASVAARGIPGVSASTLSNDIESTASIEGQLLFVNVIWPDKRVATTLTNAVAHAFIRQERGRLNARYAIIHANLLAQQRHLATLSSNVHGSSQSAEWLRAQYADTASKIYQEDADARIQVQTQVASLQVVQPSIENKVKAVGPRASINGALGAALGLLFALIAAYLSTSSYGEAQEQGLRQVFTSVGE
jgi:capsular polysaccharide biosynthesis protein